jgi:hypothetical protein
MANEQAPQQEPQIFKLTTEQIDQLDRLGPGPEAERFASSLGSVALGEGNVAVIVETDERGEEHPQRLVHLGADLGTTINLEKNENDKKYPRLEDAFEQVKTEKKAQKDDEATRVSRIIEDSGLNDVIKRYESVISDIETGARYDSAALDAASEDVDSLLRAAQREADDGPWAGNHFTDHRDLVRRAEDAVDTLRGIARKASNEAADTPVSQLQRYNRDFTGVSERLESGLAGVRDERGRYVVNTVVDANETLGAVARGLADSDEASAQSLMRIASELDSFVTDRHATVSDVVDILRRAKMRLEQSLEDLQQRPRYCAQVTQKIDQIQRTLER